MSLIRDRLVVGDFNMCMSPIKDRCALFQSTPPVQAQKLSTSFCKLVRSYNFYDTWWVKHPTHKQYTLFSPCHKLYSRLDHFFVTAPLLSYVVTLEINPIIWSDHAPINLDFILSAMKPRTCNWRLNESMLRNPESQALLQQKLSEFFLNKWGFSVRDIHLVGSS